MGPRVGLSTALILGAVTLLIAIAVGNAMGSRVIRQVTARLSFVAPTPFPVAKNVPSDSAEVPTWKEEQVMSVATDPGFPDPRVTPEPPPTPTPRPPPTAAPKRSPAPTPTAEPTEEVYTSPPLPIPLASPSPFSEERTPNRGAESTAPRGAGAGRGVSASPTSSSSDYTGPRP